jgi:hypothetical protein
MTLEEIYNKHKKGDWPDKNSIHSYIPVYEEILAPYRHTAKNILEIGLMNGESLRMWTDYFDGTVYGMDCSETPVDGLADLKPIMAEGKYNVCIGDATNPEDIERYFKGIKFSVVIEDANHDPLQQQQIYLALKPYLAEDSIYIIEDVVPKNGIITFFDGIDPMALATTLDRRHIKNRFDDCLIIIQTNKE